MVYKPIREEVDHPICKHNSAGSYAVGCDVSNLASGIYLYRLEAGDFFLTRKRVLMKYILSILNRRISLK